MSITKKEYEKLKTLSAIWFDTKQEDEEVMWEIGNIVSLLQKLDDTDVSEVKDNFDNTVPMHLNKWVAKLSKEETDDILSNARQIEGNAIVTSPFVGW